jgi:hypothetical protein
VGGIPATAVELNRRYIAIYRWHRGFFLCRDGDLEKLPQIERKRALLQCVDSDNALFTCGCARHRRERQLAEKLRNFSLLCRHPL